MARGAARWPNDVRYAVRALGKSPAFSLTVIAVLALGIGLNAAVFTLLKSLALSPLAGVADSAAWRRPERDAAPAARRPLVSRLRIPPRPRSRVRRAPGSALATVNLGLGSRGAADHGRARHRQLLPGAGRARPARPHAAAVGRGRARPAPGRRPQRRLWRRAFAADPDIVGKTIRLNTYPLTVVGVADPAFHGTIVSFDVEVFVPIMMAPQIGAGILRAASRSSSTSGPTSLVVMGRLRPGLTRADAGAQMAGCVRSAEARGRRRRTGPAPSEVVPFWRSPFGAQTYLLPAVVALSAMAVLLLAIVCANVTGLVLARGVSRRGEISLRLALGASRSRIVRLLLVEHAVLAVPGALAGLALVRLGLPRCVRPSWRAAPVRLFFNLSVDRLVMTFSAVAGCGSALVFGLFPALNGARVDLLSAIKNDLSPRGPGRARVRTALVVSQVAVSVLLLVGAGLVARSLDASRRPTSVSTRTTSSDPARSHASGYDAAPGLDLSRGCWTGSGPTPGSSRPRWREQPLTFVDSGAPAGPHRR